jgi:hypothetical protein
VLPQDAAGVVGLALDHALETLQEVGDFTDRQVLQEAQDRDGPLARCQQAHQVQRSAVAGRSCLCRAG